MALVAVAWWRYAMRSAVRRGSGRRRVAEAYVVRELVGDELYVEVWGASGAPALLYLHGGPGQGCYEFVQHQAARLSDKVRVVALDQRGVLRSAPALLGGPLSVADLVADCEI